MFGDYLERWRLTADGAPIITHSSRLLPVRRAGEPAMLKIALHPEEQLGGRLMAWWDGRGAARVLAHDDDALLMERACEGTSLADLARSGHDDQATRIICAAVARLHVIGSTPAFDLVPLAEWFEPLPSMAEAHGGVLRDSAAAASELLRTQRDIVALHGDIHHGNVLDFGPRGWLVIDPKGLVGERGYDYANLFCNPDEATAATPGRMARQLEIVAAAANSDRRRLLQWIVAWAGLSAMWMPELDLSPRGRLRVAEIAASALRG